MESFPQSCPKRVVYVAQLGPQSILAGEIAGEVVVLCGEAKVERHENGSIFFLSASAALHKARTTLISSGSGRTATPLPTAFIWQV